MAEARENQQGRFGNVMLGLRSSLDSPVSTAYPARQESF
ncbi:hypothetical protein TM48_01400 [Mycobacterium shottsii]|nr:hypothetical protein TM48_01400 [Mycobacterium shottsii]